MKTIQLETTWMSPGIKDSERTSINEERLENKTILSFFVIACSCCAHTMWEVEHVPLQLNEHGEPEKVAFECPGCGEIHEMLIECNNYHGVSTKILESWDEGTAIQGISVSQTKTGARTT